jgi:glucan biosynthesis protein C
VNTQTVHKSAKPARRWDIDWLRVLAVLLLFYYHPARIFYRWGGWYIEDVPKSKGLSYIALFIEQWHMPLFFLLAGVSTWFALRKRSGGQYLTERFKRLLVPLIFGLLVIVPPQIYFELLHSRRITSRLVSYLDFYPHYFDSRYTGEFDMGHLWFIAYLFGFSLVALPFFLYLKRAAGQRVLDRLAGFLTQPGMIFLLTLPALVTNYLLLDFYPNPIYFLTFFVYGYLLVADPRFEKTIDRHKGIALVLGVGLYVVWLSLLTRNEIRIDWMQPIPRDLINWCCMIALLGYGRKFLSFSNRFLRYVGEASYPLYILHQTVIVIIGYYMVQWDIPASLGAGTGVLLKFAIIVGASLVVTVALYDLLVKRVNLIRFLFGMRPKRVHAPAERRRAAVA